MAIFKCKMCGGDLQVQDGACVVECGYCGTKQTVSATDDEKRINLYNRANHLRMNSEFDKAASLYEQIVAEFPNDAEAYWGLCLCNYGIEYVDDPVTSAKIPTIHRASFEKMRKDENYERALENADATARIVYQEQAKEIDRIMGEVLAISRDEQPYDIFICYKETDEVGGRTVDSVIAQNIYDALTDKGYKVFFSRITLEDKLGAQYEPYIFAALNSAKVMLAVGTDYEYYNAVWVKNEWRRFWKLASADKTKVLIPCYKDMDVYDLPNEFKVLQAQDMGKVGAMQDLVRGIDKIFGRDKKAVAAAAAPVPIRPTAAPVGNVGALLKRAFMFLEDGEWQKADEFCEQVLNQDPENGNAYFGKLLAELRVKKPNELKDFPRPFDQLVNYQKVLRFGDNNLKNNLVACTKYINDRNESQCYELIDKANGAFALIDSIQERINIKNAELSNLGLFATSQKKSIRNTLHDLSVQLHDAEDTMLKLPLKTQMLVDKGFVYFGNYHGAIKWRILSKAENKILIISDKALDCQKYNTSYTGITWETCSLRKWMNGTFLDNAFSADEQSKIATTTVSADKNPNYSTNPGNATTDKVFLLSITEVEKYFSSDSARRCKPTEYAVANGAYVDSGDACFWWLRSPGYSQDYAADVHIDGSVNYYGYRVGLVANAVRPAMWIDLSE